VKNLEKNRLAEDLDHILDHTKDILEEFRDSRIFITGGTGFFGKWILETFARANEQLGLNTHAVILTRHYQKFLNKTPHLATDRNFQFIEGDIKDFAFPEGSFSHLFHLATEASDELNRTEPGRMFDTIVTGMKHVLDLAVATEIEKILFTSSGAVYGPQPVHLTHIPEDYLGAPDCLNPVSAYGEGKRAAELLCSIYARQFGLSIKIARCFAFVGPYLPLDKHFAIGNFILDGIRKKPILIKGDGTPYRSYLYATDLVIWLFTLLVKGKNCYPYNVGSDHRLSLLELAETISGCFEPSMQIDIMKAPDPKKEIKQYVPSVSRATTELGLKERIDLTEAIMKTIRFAEQGYE